MNKRTKGSIHVNADKYKRIIVILLFICIGLGLYFYPQISDDFTVHAYGTNANISVLATKLWTGSISDDGETKGALLEFYIQGKDIKNIRFSCKNQYIDFTDWTGKRPSFSMKKQFNIPYGADEADYIYMVVTWKPEKTIRKLTESRDMGIEDLDEDLRQEVVVIEVTFLDGEKTTKAIKATLNNDGSISASLDDYAVTENDNFILNPQERPPSQPRIDVDEEPEPQPTTYSKEVVEKARLVATEYYSSPTFVGDRAIVSIKYTEDLESLKYAVGEEFINHQIIAFKAYEKWLYPDAIARHILLARETNNDDWVIINEGY